MSILLVSEYQLQQSRKVIGWSESMCFNFASLSNEAIAAMTGLPNGYLGRRVLMFGAGVVMTAARATVLTEGAIIAGPQRRISTPLPILLPTYPGTGILPYYNLSFANKPADFGQTVQLVRLATSPTTSPQYRKSVWFSGMPDDSQLTDRVTQVTVAAALDTLLAGMVQNQVCIRSIDQAVGTNPLKICTGIDVTGLIYTVPGLGALPGQRVVASGFRADPGGTAPRGTYVVATYADPLLTLRNAGPVEDVRTLGGFRFLKFIVNNVTARAIGSITNKKRGRPLSLLRGRQSAAKTSRA